MNEGQKEPCAGFEGGACSPDGAPDSSAETAVRPVSKALIVFGVLLAALLVVHLTPLKALLSRGHEAVRTFRDLGWIGPALFMFTVTALVAIGVPRLIFCPIGGLAFGFLGGLLWTQLATLVGSYATFAFVRWGGRPYVVHRWPWLDRYAARVKEHGIVSVILMRQVPVSGLIINVILGLTHVGHAEFLVGTAIGGLPEAIPMTLLGASGAQKSLRSGIAMLLTAIVLVLAMTLALVWHTRRRRRSAVKDRAGAQTEVNRGPGRTS